jgi:hypothetical protein
MSDPLSGKLGETFNPLLHRARLGSGAGLLISMI